MAPEPEAGASSSNNECEQHWESLERTMNEAEVLGTIYGDDDDDRDRDLSPLPSGASSFAIVSPRPDELSAIKRTLGAALDGGSRRSRGDLPPVLRVEIRTRIEPPDASDDRGEGWLGIILRCRLPRGYPASAPAVVTSVQSHPPLTRSSVEEITRVLNEKAVALLGTEAILDLVEEAKALCYSKHRHNEQNGDPPSHRQQTSSDTAGEESWGRRWIWVHHITKRDRIRSILAAAEERDLRGILKYGHPGVVLVEGPPPDCAAFVRWIKADKSSPLGVGFGRQWGHHVRGELDGVARHCGSLRTMDDLTDMADYCDAAGLGDEFREFVLRHKAG